MLHFPANSCGWRVSKRTYSLGLLPDKLRELWSSLFIIVGNVGFIPSLKSPLRQRDALMS